MADTMAYVNIISHQLQKHYQTSTKIHKQHQLMYVQRSIASDQMAKKKQP